LRVQVDEAGSDGAVRGTSYGIHPAARKEHRRTNEIVQHAPGAPIERVHFIVVQHRRDGEVEVGSI
jgi:hypothetical protein